MRGVERRFKATTNVNHRLPAAPNLLEQKFVPTTPNQVWVAVQAYVATQECWLYIAGIKDVFKYEIVSYTIGERMTQKLTGQALCMALRNKCPPVGLIHHSNRSAQYCTQDYRVIQQNRV